MCGTTIFILSQTWLSAPLIISDNLSGDAHSIGLPKTWSWMCSMISVPWGWYSSLPNPDVGLTHFPSCLRSRLFHFRPRDVGGSRKGRKEGVGKGREFECWYRVFEAASPPWPPVGQHFLRMRDQICVVKMCTPLSWMEGIPEDLCNSTSVVTPSGTSNNRAIVSLTHQNGQKWWFRRWELCTFLAFFQEVLYGEWLIRHTYVKLRLDSNSRSVSGFVIENFTKLTNCLLKNASYKLNCVNISSKNLAWKHV